MTTPMTAVVLLRRRWIACWSGDSERSSAADTARPAGNAASPRAPRNDSPPLAISPSSGVPDPRIQERVGQVHEQVDDHERERGDEREALHLLVVAGDDG